MNIRQRASLALEILLNGGNSSTVKVNPYSITTSINPSNYKGMDKEFAVYAAEGFNMNSVVYAGFMYIIRAVASAPLMAYTGEKADPILVPSDDRMQQLMSRPNPYMSGATFASIRTLYYKLAGDSFVLVSRDPDGTPNALYPLRPDRVKPIEMPDGRINWVYVKSNQTVRDGLRILAEDMIHDKMPNPLDPLESRGFGMSPLTPAASSVDVDNKMSSFLNLLMDNGVMPPGILTTENLVTDEDAKRIQRRFSETYGGHLNWNKIPVLDQRMTYQRIGMTLDEMIVPSMDERNETRILNAIGVPPMLVGSQVGMQNSTYANYQEARQSFWEDFLPYDLRVFEDECNEILGGGRYFFMHDLSQVPALQENLMEKIEAARGLWEMGVPFNIAATRVGLDLEEIMGGNIGFISASLQAIIDEESITNPSGDENSDDSDDDSDVPEDDDDDIEENGDDTEDDDQEKAMVVSRNVLMQALTIAKENLMAIDPEPKFYKAYFESWTLDETLSLYKSHGLLGNDRFLKELFDTVHVIAMKIAKSGKATMSTYRMTHGVINYALDTIMGIESGAMLHKYDLISDKTHYDIEMLRNTVLNGYYSKATVRIHFVDGDVSITDLDVTDAIDDVSDDSLLYELLNAEIED